MITLHNPTADVFIPDDVGIEKALHRTTHLGIGAHQDDLEILAFHGILECFEILDRWFTGVVCTNGAGSPRAGVYANHSDAAMQRVRLQEQRTAASIGKYSTMLQLGYPSSAVKDPANTHPAEDLMAILKATQPQVVYTHNPADKHATHVGVLASVIQAIRALAPEERPEKLYGCEVWRDLDWLPDNRKVVLDVSGRQNLAAALVGVFDSQVAGGKRYDLASLGRRRANATYLESHSTDVMESATYAIDLSPLLHEDDVDIVSLVLGLIDEFRSVVQQQLTQMLYTQTLA
jgi:LmbE family N-acetylglucosaminyl deacetylase